MCFIIQQQSLPLNNTGQTIQLIQYDTDRYSRQLFSTHRIQQPVYLDEWVAKRQAQFLAGRIAARNALQAINGKQKNTALDIGIGTHREPLWPINIKGSISHDGDISIATATQQKTAGIGLDIQTIFNDQQTRQYGKLILSQADQALFQENKDNGMSDNLLMTLIFSAKESFFKAVFHQVKAYFDFNVVSITSLNRHTDQLSLASDVALGEAIKPGDEFSVDFEQFSPHVSSQKQSRIITLTSDAV